MEKTIAAISTGMTASGIIIVRMSGPEAVEIADRVFRAGKKGKRLSRVPSHTIHHGFITDGAKDLDEVLVSVMLAPHTYTGEDTVEINCHGGVLVSGRVLSLLYEKGAVPAEPGEFTKRAFLNGRMDLARAEAVADLISAKNDFALRSSVSQLKGAVSEKIRGLREEILDRIAFIEAALDDPEHYDLSGFSEVLSEELLPLMEELRNMIRRADDGAVLKEGIRTVISGRPNAGKSSLLNILAGYERAIVTEIAGTTRDVLTEEIILRGISLILMDTAGIRETDDRVEKIGVDRAKEAIANADLVLYLADATEGLLKEDLTVIRGLSGKNVIVLLNKQDLLKEDPSDTEKSLKVARQMLSELPEVKLLPFSSVTREGLPELEDEILSMFTHGELGFNEEIIITSLREKELLRQALESLELSKEGADAGVSEELVSIDLLNAYRALGEILGEEVDDDVIDRVFEKFCMGK